MNMTTYKTSVSHAHGTTIITLAEWPEARDWYEVYRRALVTIGKRPIREPPDEWIREMLEARHSPIRRAWYSFELINLPSNTATHFCRHVHAQPYVSSLRNDRQDAIDGDMAPRCAPVDMILDVNAEELMVMANKRLCNQAAPVTRQIMAGMAELAVWATPQLAGLLVPMCEWCGGVCHEMRPCGQR